VPPFYVPTKVGVGLTSRDLAATFIGSNQDDCPTTDQNRCGWSVARVIGFFQTLIFAQLCSRSPSAAPQSTVLSGDYKAVSPQGPGGTSVVTANVGPSVGRLSLGGF